MRRLQKILAGSASIQPANLDREVDRLMQPGLQNNHETLNEAILFINETYRCLLEAAACGKMPGGLLEIKAEESCASELLRVSKEVVDCLPPSRLLSRARPGADELRCDGTTGVRAQGRCQPSVQDP